MSLCSVDSNVEYSKIPAFAQTQKGEIKGLSDADIPQLVAEHGSPLLVLDCDSVRTQYEALSKALPNVTLHYALKPLPHPAVVATLRDIGASFDLATNGEVELVEGLGIDPEKCIHTHPIKRDGDIRRALEYGCYVFVVDNLNELEKFIAYRDQAEILIRLSFRNPNAYSDLSKKFGCSPTQAIDLLVKAQEFGIRVKGLSFHVGSQTLDSQKYVDAILESARVIRKAAKMGLPALSTLDIGGGFPVPYNESVPAIDDFCAPIREALDVLPDTVQVIAEPGRFIVAGAMTGVASVMGKALRDGKMWYYLDDGLYGSFSGITFDHGDYPISAPFNQGQEEVCVLAGPTCDSIDVISENISLPELNNGDFIVSRMMGAYTSATATEFNFFPKAKIHVMNEFAVAEESVKMTKRHRA
ncbi:type III PLP-dependent enzyme [Sessilibacter sp. MAH2]